MHHNSAHALAHARTEGNERDSTRIQRTHRRRRPSSASVVGVVVVDTTGEARADAAPGVDLGAIFASDLTRATTTSTRARCTDRKHRVFDGHVSFAIHVGFVHDDARLEQAFDASRE